MSLYELWQRFDVRQLKQSCATFKAEAKSGDIDKGLVRELITFLERTALELRELIGEG